MKGSIWTDAQTKLLMSSAEKMTAAEIAAALGKSEVAVWSRAYYLRKKGVDVALQKSGENHYGARHSDHDVELCRQLHDAGVSMAVVAEKMEIPLGTARDLCSYRSRRLTASQVLPEEPKYLEVLRDNSKSG